MHKGHHFASPRYRLDLISISQSCAKHAFDQVISIQPIAVSPRLTAVLPASAASRANPVCMRIRRRRTGISIALHRYHLQKGGVG